MYAAIAQLIPMLGPAGGVVVGLILGVTLQRRFVMGAVGDSDAAHVQAIATHRQLAEDAIDTHRRLAGDLANEFADYRERAATERAGLEERLAMIMRRLDECRDESYGLLARVAVLEAHA